MGSEQIGNNPPGGVKCLLGNCAGDTVSSSFRFMWVCNAIYAHNRDIAV